MGAYVGRMPKMQVYLPAELYERVQSRTDRVNVSGMLQDALAERLADLERLDARLALARRSAQKIVTHAGIVGQVWRRPQKRHRRPFADGTTQTALFRFR